MTTPPPIRLTTSGQSFVVVDSSLNSATPITVAVTFNNSRGSIVLYDSLILPLAPPTCTSFVRVVTATSITLQVTSTMSTYRGYTVIVNGTKVCVASCHGYKSATEVNDFIWLFHLMPITGGWFFLQWLAHMVFREVMYCPGSGLWSNPHYVHQMKQYSTNLIL